MTMAQLQQSILARLIRGESPLLVAQQMQLTEKQLTQVMKDANAIQVDFLKQEASTYQQMQIARLETMYNFAIERAFADYDMGETSHKGHLGWFDAAHRIINSLTTIIKPYLNQETTKTGDFFITVINGTVAFEKAKHLSHLVGKSMFEVIEGRSDVVESE